MAWFFFLKQQCHSATPSCMEGGLLPPKLLVLALLNEFKSDYDRSISRCIGHSVFSSVDARIIMFATDISTNTPAA